MAFRTSLLEADLSPCLINQLKTKKKQKNDNPKLDKENKVVL